MLYLDLIGGASRHRCEFSMDHPNPLTIPVEKTPTFRIFTRKYPIVTSFQVNLAYHKLPIRSCIVEDFDDWLREIRLVLVNDERQTTGL